MLLPALLPWACTPVPPAAAPTQEPTRAARAPRAGSVPEEGAAEATTASDSSAIESAAEAATVDFTNDVQPILEAGCRPCHFAGGKMYEELAFDRPETIRSLGEGLFTRIKDEEEQALLRKFLAQEAESSAGEWDAEGPW